MARRHGKTEDVAIGEANAVIAYGSSHTTEAIRPRVSAGKPFLSYGARIGFSLIGREALRADTHVQTVANYGRGRGHLRPAKLPGAQTIYVEHGGAISRYKNSRNCWPTSWNFATTQISRSTPSDTESLAICRARSQTEMQALFMTSMTPDSAAQADPQAPFVIESPQGTDWTVLYYPNTHSIPRSGTPLNRTINIVAVDQLKHALPTETTSEVKRHAKTCAIVDYVPKEYPNTGHSPAKPPSKTKRTHKDTSCRMQSRHNRRNPSQRTTATPYVSNVARVHITNGYFCQCLAERCLTCDAHGDERILRMSCSCARTVHLCH